MLNEQDVVANDKVPRVVEFPQQRVTDYMNNGQMNSENSQVLSNIRSSIRRGLPQMKAWPKRSETIALVGSGPSLAETEELLRETVWNGAVLVTLNGAYHWCRERNLRPQTQIVVDSRSFNARFVQPYVPKCNYVLASQCAPEVFDAVESYPDVWIFHPVAGIGKDELDRYYQGQWIGTGGGSTVATRAINLLWTCGYHRFELFGIDCCWLNGQHHAVEQPENQDRLCRFRFWIENDVRDFICAPWHVKQWDDFMTLMKLNGSKLELSVNGSGLLAFSISVLGRDDVKMQQEELGNAPTSMETV